MRLAFDTNLLVRFFTADNPEQHARVVALIAECDRIAVPIVTLCETVWVLRMSYRVPTETIADRLGEFLLDERVLCDRELCDAGLALLREGGDFADAVIALDGIRLGGEALATFDKEAAALLADRAVPVTLLH